MQIAWERMAGVLRLFRRCQDVDDRVVMRRTAQDDDELRLRSTGECRVVQPRLLSPQKNSAALQDLFERAVHPTSLNSYVPKAFVTPSGRRAAATPQTPDPLVRRPPTDG